MTEKAITLCGHGSGNPSTKNMYTYNSNRYAMRASNGKHKGVVAVRRYRGLTDTGRRKFVAKYKTILGRNRYSQDLREYVFKKYGSYYYSDCSSSLCATLDAIGYDCPLYNTAGIYWSDKFEEVPVVIKNGHITNPGVLKVGDFILYVGNDPSRPRQIGHVEGVYSISNSKAAKEAKEETKKSTGRALNETKQWTGIVKVRTFLSVRTWGGTNYPEVSFSPLKNGRKIDICDEIKGDDGHTWYFIKVNGKFGFVHSAYVQTVIPADKVKMKS